MYYVHPAMIGPLDSWQHHLARCRKMGFDCVVTAPVFAPGEAGDIFLTGDLERTHPIFGANRGADELVAALAHRCRQNELKLIIDIVIDRVDPKGRLAASRPDLFAAISGTEQFSDPRRTGRRGNAAYARFDSADAANALVDLWGERLGRLLDAGATGFRLLNPQSLPAELWRAMTGRLKHRWPDFVSLAWTPGLSWSQITALAGAGFDGTFSSVAWWDYRAKWFVEEYDMLRSVAPVIGCPEPPFGPRLTSRLGPDVDLATAYRRALRVAAATCGSLLVPMGFERADHTSMDARRATPDDPDDDDPHIDVSEDVEAANALVDKLSAMGWCNEIRTLTDPDDKTTVLVRLDAQDARQAGGALAILINPDLKQIRKVDISLHPLPPAAGVPLGDPSVVDGVAEPDSALEPGEARLIAVTRTTRVRQRIRGERQLLTAAMGSPRIIVDRIAPTVDGGRFAVKRVVGAGVTVEADIFTDGHGMIAADLLWKAADEKDWHVVPMRPRDNDRWSAAFSPARVGRHIFTIEAWSDEYDSLCHDIDVKHQAGLDHCFETDEACRLIEAARERADGAAKDTLTAALGKAASTDGAAARNALLAQDTRAAMRRVAPRRFQMRHEPALPVEIERPQAGTGAWYEMFPRSASPQPGRHGTFADVIRRLPAVRAMGFDVLYFPPVHPIGTSHRKGRNNSLLAGTDDPGSPYAIGGPKGGHDALHPALGNFDDFSRLQTAAAAHGIEIALDFAVHCSPDHPWLKQHPAWFSWRSDGSIRHAENPPKKYEDIVNVEFYPDAQAPELWIALRDIVLFWTAQGINIFRVDNPHTKPLPFWEWLIAEVRNRHPDVIFLAEAFTRPKMMHRLAKLGFSQSYTYFTWRNTKQELMEYLRELSIPPVSDYFRPHFFVNTPDINPYFLQHSGRAGFLIRAALAATLSGLWGMYSGFEICEAAALPGREEYRDSEKYEIKARDYDTPGNIVAEIAMLNRIRRTHPALQQQLGLTFHNAYNEQVLVYAKSSPQRHDMILVAVSLDPHGVQEATFEVPLWQLGLPDDGAVAVQDLVHDHRFVWTGKLQRVRLDPADMPFAIWRIACLAEHRS